jgi:putative two-component system response regulator
MADTTAETTAQPIVLVVDDAPEVASLISAWLRDRYRVYVAHTGLDAMKMADEVRPQLAIIDILMARPNGFDIAETLRAQSTHGPLAILFMTGLPRPENDARARQVGAVGILHKPFERDVLLANVERALGR